jgi:hypothetical protein
MSALSYFIIVLKISITPDGVADSNSLKPAVKDFPARFPVEMVVWWGYTPRFYLTKTIT